MFGDRKDGIGEADALLEIFRVSTEVFEVGLQSHAAWRWPGAVGEVGAGSNVGDAGGPGGVVGGVVIRAERLKSEAIGARRVRYGETGAHDRLVT